VTDLEPSCIGAYGCAPARGRRREKNAITSFGHAMPLCPGFEREITP
jgi:hypothetical protein